MSHLLSSSGEKLQFAEDQFSIGSQDGRMDQYTTGSRDCPMDQYSGSRDGTMDQYSGSRDGPMDQYSGSRDGSMDHSGSIPGLRPVLRPMKNSDRVVEDADLIAIEKSEDGQIHAFKVVESVNKNDSAEDADDERMNFSYHPILEYLNM